MQRLLTPLDTSMEIGLFDFERDENDREDLFEQEFKSEASELGTRTERAKTDVDPMAFDEAEELVRLLSDGDDLFFPFTVPQQLDHVFPMTPNHNNTSSFHPGCISPSGDSWKRVQVGGLSKSYSMPIIPTQLCSAVPKKKTLSMKRKSKPRRIASPRTSTSAQDINSDSRSIILHPRDFPQLCKALGADLIEEDGHSMVRLADNQFPYFPPLENPLNFVEHERTYFMSGSISLKERRCYDIFSDRDIGANEKSFWCDQGNAHCVLDTSKPVRLSQAGGNHVNPRTIQVAHAIASRVSSLQPTEKPVIKCYYYSLHRRSAQRARGKRQKVPKGDHSSTSLGLHKHVYILCSQNVEDRHKLLEGSKVWLVRYFVKGDLHEAIKPFVQAPTEPLLSRKGSAMSLC